MIILPDQFVKLSDVIARLQVDKLLSYNDLPMKEAHIEIPKFTIRSDTDLKGVLQKVRLTLCSFVSFTIFCFVKKFLSSILSRYPPSGIISFHPVYGIPD